MTDNTEWVEETDWANVKNGDRIRLVKGDDEVMVTVVRDSNGGATLYSRHNFFNKDTGWTLFVTKADLKRREDLRTRPVPRHDGIYMSSKRMWSPLLIREAGQWYLASFEPLSDDGYQRFVLEAEDLVRLQRNDGLRMTYDLGGYV